MARQVVLYHQPGCPPCEWAREFLERHGVAFTEKDVREDEKALEELMALGSESTPTLVIDGKVLIGFDPEKILALLGQG